MPTALPRHTITETPAVSEALAQAALLWPEDADRPTRLLLRLIERGVERLEEQERDRRKAVAELAGSMPGVWDDFSLEDLRNEWPA
ncbi:MAG: hypothetical protein QM572_06690 [Nocardioides sp.]|uniref:hypothetical protein n=1 Tax=Nocardioides sp. TaxID=35761 RepID=UPI0039E3141B